jgi:hypothetical protein
VAADPKQIPQSLSRRLGIERIAPVDQREKKAGSMRVLQKNVNQKRAACAQIRATQFRDDVFRQSADRGIDSRQSSPEPISSRLEGLGETFRQQLSKIDNPARGHASKLAQPIRMFN